MRPRSCSTRLQPPIVTEEQFGPALPVIPYDGDDDAIAQANDTWAGLCSSVWSGDPEHAMASRRSCARASRFFNNHNATAVTSARRSAASTRAGSAASSAGRACSFHREHVMSVPS